MIKVRIDYIELLEEAKEDDLYEKYSDRIWWQTIRGLDIWLQRDRKNRLKAMDWILKQIVPLEAAVFEEYKDIITFRQGEEGPTARGARYEYGLDPIVMGDGLEGPVVDAHLSKTVRFYLKRARGRFTRRAYKAFDEFQRYNKQLKIRDINQYTDLDHLMNSIHKDVYAKRAEKSMKKFDKIPAEDSTRLPMPEPFTMVRPETMGASCRFGKGGNWCISQQGNPYFGDYTQGRGKTYFFVQDHSRKDDDRFYKVAFQVVPAPVTIAAPEKGKVKIEVFFDRNNNEHTNIDVLKAEYGEDVVDQIVKNIEDNMEQAGPAADPLQLIINKIRVGQFDETFRDADVKFFARMLQDDVVWLTARTDIRFEIPEDGIEFLADNFDDAKMAFRAEKLLKAAPREEIDLIPSLEQFDDSYLEFNITAPVQPILFSVEVEPEYVRVEVKHRASLKMGYADRDASRKQKAEVVKIWIDTYQSKMFRPRKHRHLRRAIKRILIKDEKVGIWISDNMNRQYREAHSEVDTDKGTVSEGKILAKKKRLKVLIK